MEFFLSDVEKSKSIDEAKKDYDVMSSSPDEFKEDHLDDLKPYILPCVGAFVVCQFLMLVYAFLCTRIRNGYRELGEEGQESESSLLIQGDGFETKERLSIKGRILRWLSGGDTCLMRLLEYTRRLFVLGNFATMCCLYTLVYAHFAIYSLVSEWSFYKTAIISCVTGLAFYIVLWIQMGIWSSRNMKYGIKLRKCGSTCFQSMWRHKILFVLFLLLFMFLMVNLSWIDGELCNPSQSTKTDHSTRFTRWYHDKDFVKCPKEGMCHVYLLLAPDPVTQMQIVCHSTGSKKTSIVYGTRHNKLDKKADVTSIRLSRVYDSERYINTALLTDLKANSTYYFQCKYDGSTKKGSKVKQFMTLPDITQSNSKNEKDVLMSFVVTGDIGVNSQVPKVTKLISEQEPTFLAIGGDLAYANRWWGCLCRWDRLFQDWTDNMETPSGNLIPIVAAIGNHESGGYELEDSDLPFAYYFPYAVDAKKPYFKKFDDRKHRDHILYHTHEVNDLLSLVTLDSGTIIPHVDQTDFLKDSLRDARNSSFKFTLYHNPLYPSYSKFDDDISEAGRIFWEDIFVDYNLTVAFEHHDHMYKRTYPLINGLACGLNITCGTGEGVVYMGDGAWGVTPRKESNENYYLEERIINSNYLLKVDLFNNKLETTAIGFNRTNSSSVSVVLDTSKLKLF